MQLEGRLEQFPLSELIEMIVYSSVRGVLEVRSADLTGHIYFRDGQPVHADADDLSGVAAVGRLFELAGGDFKFHLGATPDEETLWQDAGELIARGQQLARQWSLVRADIGSLRWVPALVGRVDRTQVQISENLWPVLALVDGQRSAQTIADELRVDALDICGALVALKRQGLIAIAPPARAVAQSPGASGERRGGFFERLIERTLEEESRNPNSRYAPPERRYVDID